MNTEKLVNGIKDKVEADIIKLPIDKAIDLSIYDNVIFASGIYFGKPAEEIEQIINCLNPQDMKNKNAFYFLTSGSNNKKYLRNALNHLKCKGFLSVEGCSINGYDTNGIFKYIGGISKKHPAQKEIEQCISIYKKHIKSLTGLISAGNNNEGKNTT